MNTMLSWFVIGHRSHTAYEHMGFAPWLDDLWSSAQCACSTNQAVKERKPI